MLAKIKFYAECLGEKWSPRILIRAFSGYMIYEKKEWNIADKQFDTEADAIDCAKNWWATKNK